MSIYGYRRGSIFWALTLIAVGGIFLYQNFNPAIHPWQIVAKFWPILIIFWGVSKLIDYMQAQRHPEAAARALFSGSEVVMLILILLLGTMISKIVLRPWHDLPSNLGIDVNDGDWPDFFGETYTYTQTVTQAVKAQPHLQIVNRRGDVEIRSTDQRGFELVVKKTIRAENEEAARKLSAQLKVEFVEQGGRYVLQNNLDALSEGGRTVRLDFNLRAPKATSAEVTAEHGDVILDGLQGDQNLTTKRGDAHVSNVEGLVRVHKTGGATEVRDVKGNVELDGHGGDAEIAGVNGTVTVNGDFSGEVQFREVTQTLRYTSSRTDMTLQRLTGRLSMEVGSLEARGIDGPFEISTRQKDMTLEDFKHNVKIANTNGDIQLRAAVAPTHTIDVESKKGDIELALPGSANFQIEASSSHGEVESEFSGPNLKVRTEGDSPSITGSIGKGGPAIRLMTAYGTIRLTHVGARPPAAPAHPAPPAKHAEGDDET